MRATLGGTHITRKNDDPLSPENVLAAAEKHRVNDGPMWFPITRDIIAYEQALDASDEAFAAGVAYALRAIRNGAEVRE